MGALITATVLMPKKLSVRPATGKRRGEPFVLAAGGRSRTLATFLKTKHENSGCAYHGDAPAERRPVAGFGRTMNTDGPGSPSQPRQAGLETGAPGAVAGAQLDTTTIMEA